jgi:hypothetical protein
MNEYILTLAIIFLTTWLLCFGYAGYLIFISQSMLKHPKPCAHKTTMKLSSISKQLCYNCNEALDWPLKPNQAPLVTSSRDKRK